MKTFNEWLKEQTINESVNITVPDVDATDFSNLDEVCFELLKKIVSPFFEKLEGDSKNKVKLHQTIMPDGSFYGKNPQKIINFYSSGFGEYVPEMINGIRYYLQEMGIKIGKEEKSRSRLYNGAPVYRFHIASMPEQDKNKMPEINWSNMNAELIFKQLLGYGGYRVGSYVDVSDLMMRIGKLTDQSYLNAVRPSNTSVGSGGATMLDHGLDVNGLKTRINQLYNLCVWAKKNHHEKLAVD